MISFNESSKQRANREHEQYTNKTKKKIFMNGCNENAIEFMTNGTKATLTFSQGRYKSVIRKLAKAS